MDFIEELYYGNILPFAKPVKNNPKYTKEIHKSCDIEEQLTKSLKDENLKKFTEFVKINNKISGINEVEFFKLGFTLGVRMMCDTMSNDYSKFFDDMSNNG